jgi:hypothetical protein
VVNPDRRQQIGDNPMNAISSTVANINYDDATVRANLYWLANSLLNRFGEGFCYSPEVRASLGFEKDLGDDLARLVIDWAL